MSNLYSKIFGLREFDELPVLQWVVAILLFGMTLAFSNGFAQDVASLNANAPDQFICPNFWQSCERFVFLSTGSATYSHHGFFAFAILGPLILAGCFLYRRLWVGLHITLLYLFSITILLFFGLDANPPVPFMMFNLVPTAVVLFSRHRLPDLRWTFVLLYFLSGLVKLDDGWIAGTYFSTLTEGLRIFSSRGIAIYTNIVIFFEVFGSWFLLHKTKLVRHFVLLFYVVFHLYSAVYVGYRYPLLTLPLLLLLFSSGETEAEPRLTATGLVLTVGLALVNLLPSAIGLQPKLTGEGAQFALNMFDANRQALISHEVIFYDGKSEKEETRHSNAYDRIRPYNKWQQLKKRCADPNIKQITYNVVMSVNGGPYREIINLPDLCSTEFSPFSHNAWIRLDGPIRGYPGKNYYYSPGGNEPFPQLSVYPSEQIELDSIGSFFLKNLMFFKIFYWALAGLSFFTMAIPRLRAGMTSSRRGQASQKRSTARV